MSSAESRPSPHVGSKVQPLPQGISSHSRHILDPPSWLAETWPVRRDTNTPKKKKTEKMEDRFEAGGLSGQQGCLDASWLLWLGGLDDRGSY